MRHFSSHSPEVEAVGESTDGYDLFISSEPRMKTAWGNRWRGRWKPRRSTSVAGKSLGSITLVALVIAVVPTALAAQSRDLIQLTTNSLLGGIAAGLAQTLRGASFTDGFKRGALGGGVHYAGKRLMSADVSGALFAGRQVSSIGASIVLNAAHGWASLDRVVFPLGPFALELDRGDNQLSLTPSVSVYDILRIAQGVVRSDRRLDWSETFQTGTVVFGSRGNELFAEGMNGATDGSIIELDDGLPPDVRLQVLLHEMVHVAQRDFLNRVWFVPLEDALIRRVADKPSAIRLEVLYPTFRKSLSLLGIFETGLPLLESEAEWIEKRY
ncbi:MAG: hypothetical protein ACE5F5_12960 [Acidimicrobiia bacterium]